MQVAYPHMTLLFRSKGFKAEDAIEVQQFIDSYLRSSESGHSRFDETSSPLVSFTLTRWGQESDQIHGELEQLARKVYEHFQHLHEGGNFRPPHVQLRRKASQGVFNRKPRR